MSSERRAADAASLITLAVEFEKANATLGDALIIQAAPNQLQFAPKELRVKAGAKVRLIFQNPDLMQHNFVLLAPGAEEEVGNLADQLATQPDGLAKGYLPVSKKILQSTPLVQPSQKAELAFTAPATPGSYPYICTFPGHWHIMRGVLVVE